MKNEIINVQTVLKGKIILEPEYLEQEVNEYKNNPCIEALPPIFDDKQVIEKFLVYPAISQEERQLRSNVRYHIIKRLKSFVQPLDKHIKIEHMLSSMIRRGYLARNLNSKEYFLRLKLINDAKAEVKGSKIEGAGEVFEIISGKLKEIPATSRSTAESSSIIGISGMGKTTASEGLFLMYPQVIFHHEYKGNPLIRTQIVWLKIDCPYDGSLKTLCKMFFNAVDDVLGRGRTKYLEKFGNNKNSTATMMMHMVYVASLHSIGVLAIDEIQHLINPKNNPDEMLNFFVTLVNVIGIPTVLIGTPKILKVLEKGLREIRRSEEAGSIFWDRMTQDDEWDFFIETMWKYQWLKQFTPLTKELNDVMYDECQGITSIAVNLFILVQAQAIFSEFEKITPELIRKVAKDDLRMTQKIINALRRNDIKEIAKYEDIVDIDIDEILAGKSQKSNLRERVSEVAQQCQRTQEIKRNTLKEQLASELLRLGLFKSLEFRDIEKIVDSAIKQFGVNEEIINIKQSAIKMALEADEKEGLKKKEKRKNNSEKINYDNEDLRKLFVEAKKEKSHIYEFLKKASYIKDPLQEFLDLDRELL